MASELHGRLKALYDAYHATSQQITSLSKLSSPTSGEAPPDDPSAARLELTAEIHQELKELEEEFELVRQEADEFTAGSGRSGRRQTVGTAAEGEKEREKVALATQVSRLGEDLRLARTQFRKAQLSAKRNEDLLRAQERQQLFAGAEDGTNTTTGVGRRRGGKDKMSQDDMLLNASGDVTAALRRTHNLMQSELERSEYAKETLQRSTAALHTLSESYTSLSSLLARSRSLVSTLVSSQKSDTWYLETAFLVLCVTAAWLVFRRLLYGPLLYFAWIPGRWLVGLLNTVLSVALGLVTGGGSAQAGVNRNAGSVPGGVSAWGFEAAGANTPLQVVPSAKGRPQPRGQGMPEGGSIRVGGGGKGGGGDSGDGGIADDVGKMVDETRRKEEEVKAGDGTVLRERTADEKPNPKKRMMEEPPPPPKDEL